jgi:xanthine dehydrogenase YagT iron-sulfur-binding subunit
MLYPSSTLTNNAVKSQRHPIDNKSGLTQKSPKSLIYRTAKTPRTPRIRRACVSPINVIISSLNMEDKSLAPITSNSFTQELQTLGPEEVDLLLNVNSVSYSLKLEPRVTLLDALREKLGLMGTKKACDRGECGACTVLVDNRRINSCMTLAVMHIGALITTIEGLAKDGELHPMQTAFIIHDAFQCGYCTSGQIVSAVGMILEESPKSEAEIREKMSGNLCRCGAYPNIIAAIQDVLEEIEHAAI